MPTAPHCERGRHEAPDARGSRGARVTRGTRLASVCCLSRSTRRRKHTLWNCRPARCQPGSGLRCKGRDVHLRDHPARPPCHSLSRRADSGRRRRRTNACLSNAQIIITAADETRGVVTHIQLCVGAQPVGRHSWCAAMADAPERRSSRRGASKADKAKAKLGGLAAALTGDAGPRINQVRARASALSATLPPLLSQTRAPWPLADACRLRTSPQRSSSTRRRTPCTTRWTSRSTQNW